MIKTSPRYVKKVEKNNVSFERSSLDIYSIMFLFCFVNTFRQDWGISSNGRAPALHAGGTGIDARILHILFSFFPSFFCLTKIMKELYSFLPWNLFCRMFLSSHRKKGGLAQMVDRPLFFFPFPCSSKLNWSKKVNKTGQYSNYRIFPTSPADSNC